jgi:hypothetical protein
MFNSNPISLSFILPIGNEYTCPERLTGGAHTCCFYSPIFTVLDTECNGFWILLGVLSKENYFVWIKILC